MARMIIHLTAGQGCVRVGQRMSKERWKMPDNAEMMQQMDSAAAEAEAELYKHFPEWKAEDVVTWWSKWYLKAGHKRLGRILVAKGRKPKA